MRNLLKRHPSADPKPTLRERFGAMKVKAAGFRSETSTGRPASPAAGPASAPSADAVSAAIGRHTQAYAERLYAEAYGTADAGSRAEQERDAFRELLHTPIASDAERLAYATAVIARASGVYGFECHGSTRAAWMPTAYRNLAFGEYAPEPDTAGHQPIALATPASLSNVEAGLTALAAEYEGFARASDEAMACEHDAGLPLPSALDNAIDRVRHFTNQGREGAVRHAMALPATTLLGFGLKAQILEHDAGAAWVENEDDVDIVRCRAFLQALIAAAGLSPMRWPEVTPGEIRGWLANPSTAPGADEALV